MITRHGWASLDDGWCVSFDRLQERQGSMDYFLGSLLGIPGPSYLECTCQPQWGKETHVGKFIVKGIPNDSKVTILSHGSNFMHVRKQVTHPHPITVPPFLRTKNKDWHILVRRDIGGTHSFVSSESTSPTIVGWFILYHGLLWEHKSSYIIGSPIDGWLMGNDSVDQVWSSKAQGECSSTSK